MPITIGQKLKASERQKIIAEDSNAQIRLVAGPGSGKSYVIQKRVNWLLENGVLPNSIFVISFTNESTNDIRDKLQKFCIKKGNHQVSEINVSTLHSLALKSLKRAELLKYPVDPIVINEWEQTNILDKEFANISNKTKTRCGEIRTFFEAFSDTGIKSPPNYIKANPPISKEEIDSYMDFYTPRTYLYSCILPGDIVRYCVENMTDDFLNPKELFGIEYLIVDEYQDLNPIDLKFIDILIEKGVNIFVAGDDDQSIYSFRYGSPYGIQTFKNRFPESSFHELTDCFRCTTTILETAQNIFRRNSHPNRMPKSLISLYKNASPPVSGIVHRWNFHTYRKETEAIAESCSLLIENGVSANEIMVLISQKSLVKELKNAFDKLYIKYDAPIIDSFYETDIYRFVLAILRIINKSDDYISYRSLLGLLRGVGPSTCNKIAENVINNNFDYKEIFSQPINQDIFTGREFSALTNAIEVLTVINNWKSEDILENVIIDLMEILNNNFDEEKIALLSSKFEVIPIEITLFELQRYIISKTENQREEILNEVKNRLEIKNETEDEQAILKVKITTMHGAKGLDAQVVFIPALVDELIPGEKRSAKTGLVLESARMMYVSLTRAKAACILSFSNKRLIYGKFLDQKISRFARDIGGRYEYRKNGLTDAEANKIISDINKLM